MAKTKTKRLIERREVVQARLDAYLKLEAEMLADPVQSYTIGSRSLSKHNMSLADLRDAIKELEEELEELDSQINDAGRRAGRAVVIKDW